MLGDSLFGLPVTKVNEFDAIGIGGTSLAGKENALVVSLGTGTAIVSVTGDKITHVSGTGLGGGTLRGLSRHMLGVSSLETLEAMARARRSDARRPDRARYRGRGDRRSAARHDRREFRQDRGGRDFRRQGARDHEHDRRSRLGAEYRRRARLAASRISC